MYMGKMGLGFGLRNATATAAAALLAMQGGYGLTIFSRDNSMSIRDASTPANDYSGSPGAKVTTTRASGATYWDASGVLQTAGNNVLRRDFDPRLASTAERCGYLIEEARTNLALRSEDFSTTWTTGRASISTDQTLAPDGTTTADKLIEDGTASNTHFVSQTIALTNASYTWSVFAKAGERTWLQITTGVTNGSVFYDLANGVVGTVGAAVTSSAIVPVGNGWYRCSLVVPTGSATNFTCACRLASADNTAAYNGDSVSGAYIWGFQCELGSFASSYIPTAGSTVTRAADLVTLAGTLFPLSQTEGTLYAKFASMGGANPQRTLSLNDGTNNEVIDGFRNTNGTLSFSIVDGGSAQLGPTGLNSTTTIAVLTQGKQAGAYKLNDSAVAQLGETVQTDIVCTMPTTTTLVLGNRGGGGRELNGWLFEVAYFPTRKTNSQLQALASGYASDALLLMGTETQGLTFSATDQSMSILDTGTPANAYTGELSAKLGSIRTSAGMTYLSSGLLGWGPENLLLQSQTFGTTWGAVNSATIVSDTITAPDGTLTGDTLVESSGASRKGRNQSITFIAGDTYTLSVHVKPKERQYIYLAFPGSNFASNRAAGFTLSGAGSVSAQDGSTVAVITALSDGWYRCSIRSICTTAGTANLEVLLADSGVLTATNPSYTGDGASGIYLWGAQLERAASASTYKPTTSAAYYGLRLDYDSRLTGGPGYLVEEARTNLCLQSQTLGTTWTTSAASVSSDATTAPDGTITADAIVESAASGVPHRITQAVTISSGATITISIYAKLNSRSVLDLTMLSGANYVSNPFDLSAGTIGADNDNVGAIFSAKTKSIQSVGNGWYRCVITATTTGVTSLTIMVGLHNGTSNSYNGDGTSNLYAWGAQIEAGAFATSYIPTTTASVTRAADIPLLLGTAFPINSSEGTLVCRGAFYGNHPTNSARLIDLSDGGNSERVLLHRNVSSRLMGFIVTDGGAGQVSLNSSGTVAENVLTGSAGAYKVNDCAVVQAGEAVLTDLIATMPTMNQICFGNRYDGQAATNGWLRHGRYFPTRKSNADLAVLAAAA